jgi:RNA polymerase sigma-70 factor, ECF subfamily
MQASLDAFATHRPFLLGIAYRMLGSRAEAEDIVQDTYLRWRDAPHDDVRSPRAFLAQVVSRLCIDQLKSARARRESYVGPWLPEPLPTSADSQAAQPDLPPDRVGLAESVSFAFLLVLESLSPTERAVFLLREVFEYDFDEIAGALGKSAPACRQLFHRAREHIVARRPRFRPAPGARERLTMSFLQACSAGDVAGLMALLREDATAISDGGGKVHAARKPLLGRDHVARFLIGVARKAPPDVSIEPCELNDCPGVVVRAGGHAISAMLLEVDHELISAIHVVANPEKLALL